MNEGDAGGRSVSAICEPRVINTGGVINIDYSRTLLDPPAHTGVREDVEATSLHTFYGPFRDMARWQSLFDCVTHELHSSIVISVGVSLARRSVQESQPLLLHASSVPL